MCARELSFHDEFVEVCVSFARELSFHDEFVEVCVSFPALLSHLARSATVESDGQLPDRQTVLRLAAVLHLACNVGKATGQGTCPPGAHGQCTPESTVVRRSGVVRAAAQAAVVVARDERLRLLAGGALGRRTDQSKQSAAGVDEPRRHA